MPKVEPVPINRSNAPRTPSSIGGNNLSTGGKVGKALGPLAILPPLLEGAKNYARTGNPLDNSKNPPGEDTYPWETLPQAGRRLQKDAERLADKAKKELDRAKDALRRLFPKDREKVPKPPGSAPDIDLSGAIPPTGEPGQYVRVRFSYKYWDGPTGSGSRGGVAPFSGFVYVTPSGGAREIYMQFADYREPIGIDAIRGPNGENYNTTYTITSIEPWPAGTPIPIPSPEPEPVPLPADFGLLPPGLPFLPPKPGDPPKLHPPAPGKPPKPVLPTPATPPAPTPRNPPTPNAPPTPNPAPGTPLNPSPNAVSPGFPAPATTKLPGVSTTPSNKLDIDPNTGKINKPDTAPDPFKTPIQGPEEMCKDPCMAGIQQGLSKQGGEIDGLKEGLEAIKKHLGVGELPATLKLITGEFPQTINNMCDLALYGVKNTDAVSGKFPMTIKVKKPDGSEPEIKLENQSHALQEMFAALLSVAEDADAAVNIGARLAVETTSTRIALQQGNAITTAIQKYLGFDMKPKADKIKLGFTPSATGANNTLENDEMGEFLKPSDQNFVSSELAEKVTLKGILERMLNGVEIVRAAHWHPVKYKPGQDSNITGDAISASKQKASKGDQATWNILLDTLKKAGFDVDEKDPPKIETRKGR
jgi:hypothetical protein